MAVTYKQPNLVRLSLASMTNQTLRTLMDKPEKKWVVRDLKPEENDIIFSLVNIGCHWVMILLKSGALPYMFNWLEIILMPDTLKKQLGVLKEVI